MTPAAISLAVYGVYLLANGVALAAAPSVPLALFVALVSFKVGPAQLLIFAGVDLVTASWTHLAIKRSPASS